MLTLFEYLRRRAFEAVIDGTQDAVEFLESQKSFDQNEAAKMLSRIARKLLRFRTQHAQAARVRQKKRPAVQIINRCRRHVAVGVLGKNEPKS